MALVVGSRIGLTTYTLGTDPRPGRLQHNAERNLLESVVVIGGQGTSADRPTAGKGRALYWNGDRQVLQWDTGTGWEDVSTNGGGGTPEPIAPNGTPAEGVSARSARADHVHFLQLVTQSAPGAMSSADKVKLDNATTTATGYRLMVRDAAGRVQVASPSAPADAATKGYVDSIVGGAAAPVVSSSNNGLATPAMLAATEKVATAESASLANTLVLRDANGRAQFQWPSGTNDAATKAYVDSGVSNHRHDGAHITTGLIPAARLPIVSSSANGAMPAGDKVKLDGATPSATNNTLAMRSASGTIAVGAPSSTNDAATKKYVDDGLSGKAASNHGHYATDITSGTVPAARLPYASSSSAGILSSSAYNSIYSHSHSAADIYTGTFSSNRLPYATSSTAGIVSASTYNAIWNHSHDATDIVSGWVPRERVWGSLHAYNTVRNPDNPARAVWATEGGEFCYNSSTIRHKVNVREWDKDPRDLLGPVPSIYNRLNPDTGEPHHADEVGIIAEQAGETVPEFLEIGPDQSGGEEHRIQGWGYAQWTTAHQLLHRWHAKRADHVDARLARIEHALGLDPLPEDA